MWSFARTSCSFAPSSLRRCWSPSPHHQSRQHSARSSDNDDDDGASTDDDVGATSFKERGDQFEALAARVFARIGCFALRRVGGKSDGGIDLEGSFERGVKILAQCKHSKHRVAPKLVREFEGALQGHVEDIDLDGILSRAAESGGANQQHNVLGLYISSAGYTKQAVDYFEHASSRPLAISVIDPASEQLLAFSVNSQARRMFHSMNSQLVLGFHYRRTSPDSHVVSKTVCSLRLSPLL